MNARNARNRMNDLGATAAAATLNTGLMALRAGKELNETLALMNRAHQGSWDIDFVSLNTFVDTLCVVGGQRQVALEVLSVLLQSSSRGAFPALSALAADA